ncbi:MAG TPA: type II toxin-antitoxin system VapC family toxin [Stellaceae bacterium]|nr:type II toxin-antitoxin system VapC family toxin [Stellaceae bacterium]
MSIVIDASVALKWVFDEPGSEAAITLLTEELMAPELWLAEAANALWRHVRLGEASTAEALVRIEELHMAPVASVPIGSYVRRALQLGIELSHPIYDCVYLALAEHRGTHVVTDDRRFFTAASVAGFERHIRLLRA